MKKIISIALALLMVAVMLPVMAMADEATTLQGQINNATSGTTITLDKDYTEDITIDKALTIDLNGKKLTNSAGDTITVNANGNLTITGNGTVDNVTHGKAALRIKENGKATLNGGYFNRSQEKGKGASESGENSFYTLINHGELTINDGAVVTTASESSTLGRYSSLVENGYQSHDDRTNNPTLTINGGTFKGGLNTIKNDDNGITNIYGGKCENYFQACVQNHHKATIHNGEFSADVSSAWSVMNCGAKCAYNENHDAHELIITNGNFKGNVRANVGKVKIEGGSFEASFTEEGNATIEISGGTFNSDVTEYAGDTLVVENNGTYYVGGTARDAIENATSGTFTVKKAENGTSLTVKPGVTVENGMNDGKVTVNGNEVKPGESYTVPGTITIIVPSDGGNTTTTPSTDNTKNPSTGANDFVGVAAALAVVSLLGAAAVIRKK